MPVVEVESLNFEKWPALRTVPKDFLDDVVLFKVMEGSLPRERQHYMMVLKNDDVYSLRYYGEDDPKENRLFKVDRLSGKGIIGVSGAELLTVGLSRSGCAYVYGSDNWGKLGLGLHVENANFEPITSLIDRGVSLRQLSTGFYHTLAISDDGLLYGWGYVWNSERERQEHSGGVYEPTVLSGIPPDEEVSDVVCGSMSSFVLTSSGNVFGFGCNSDGELGIGTMEEEVWEPTRVILPEKAKKVVVGACNGLALTISGKLYLWGLLEESCLLSLDPPPAPDSFAIPIPAKLLSIDKALDIASTHCSEIFAISTEDGYYKISFKDRRMEIVKDEGASNIAEVFGAEVTPCILIRPPLS